jgi:hypothetical protein
MRLCFTHIFYTFSPFWDAAGEPFGGIFPIGMTVVYSGNDITIYIYAHIYEAAEHQV